MTEVVKCHYCDCDLSPEEYFELEEIGWHPICYGCLSDSSKSLLPQYAEKLEER